MRIKLIIPTDAAAESGGPQDRVRDRSRFRRRGGLRHARLSWPAVPRGPVRLVFREPRVGGQLLQSIECRAGAQRLRDGQRAIDGDHRRARKRRQRVVKLRDRLPVGLPRASTIDVRRLQGAFELIPANGAWSAGAPNSTNNASSFRSRRVMGSAIPGLAFKSTPPRIFFSFFRQWRSRRRGGRRGDYSVGNARTETYERHRCDQWVDRRNAAPIDHRAVLVIIDGVIFDGDPEFVSGPASRLRSISPPFPYGDSSVDAGIDSVINLSGGDRFAAPHQPDPRILICIAVDNLQVAISRGDHLLGDGSRFTPVAAGRFQQRGPGESGLHNLRPDDRLRPPAARRGRSGGEGEVARNDQVSRGVSRYHAIVIAGSGNKIGERDLMSDDERCVQWSQTAVGGGASILYPTITRRAGRPRDDGVR